MLQPAMLSTDGLTIPQEADCKSRQWHAQVVVSTQTLKWSPAQYGVGVIEAGCQLSKGASLHSSQRL